MKDRLQIDIGVGDVVDEYEMGLNLLKYKDEPLLGDREMTLFAYPPEFIFSEKLQAIVELKILNSRMKDYFDCVSLIQEDVLNPETLKDAINRTFEKRSTEVGLLEDFSEDLEPLRASFKRKVSTSPETIKIAIETINDYLKTIGLS